MYAFYSTVKQDESIQQLYPKIILYNLIAHFQICFPFYKFVSLSEPITNKMSDIHSQNTFTVKSASMKLQVLVKQLSNSIVRSHESKNNYWQLKELISGVAKNQSYHTTITTMHWL